MTRHTFFTEAMLRNMSAKEIAHYSACGDITTMPRTTGTNRIIMVPYWDIQSIDYLFDSIDVHQENMSELCESTGLRAAMELVRKEFPALEEALNLINQKLEDIRLDANSLAEEADYIRSQEFWKEFENERKDDT